MPKVEGFNEILRFLVAEFENFNNWSDKREYVIVRCEELFDEYFVPIDLPGPDGIIDPLLCTAIRPLAGRLYDEVLKKLNN